MVSQCGPLSLYTKLEGLLVAKIGFMLSTVWPLDDSQGLVEFHDHGSWPCV